MSQMRSNSARNRKAILQAARTQRSAGRPLQFNALAAAADVGVGTVYRHFADVEELTETLVLDLFQELQLNAAAAVKSQDPDRVARFFTYALGLLVNDPDFGAVATRQSCALAETSSSRQLLMSAISDLLDSARERGDFVTEFSTGDMVALTCGAAYAVRHSEAPPDRAAAYLRALLAGAQLPIAEG